ncbi:hypothetical protein ACFLTH_09390 [Bacteroidota bacterium]
MNLKFLKLIVLCLTFLYLINTVSANFGYNTEADVLKACRCSEITDILKIKNTGTETTVYTLSSNLDYVEFSPSEFELQAGKFQDVIINIDAPCKTATKDLKIRVKSEAGDNKVLKKTLIMGQCQNLKAGLQVDEDEINPCEEVVYTLHVWNEGPFTENYVVNSNFNDYINFSAMEVEIEPESKSEISARLSLPCRVYGETPVEFTVLAQKNNLQSTLKHDLMINQYYSYTLEVEEETQMCEETPESIKIKIENDVSTPNIYHLNLVNAPFFIKLSNDTISLNGEESAEIEILVEAEEGKHTGNYNLILKTGTEYGDIINDRNITINISDCYDLSVQIIDKNLNFCSQEQVLTVLVENKGTEAESIELSSNLDWADLNMQRVSLESSESIEAILTLDPADADFSYDLEVTGNLIGKNVSASDEKRIKVISQKTCHFVDVSNKAYSIRRDTENNVSITLTNDGYEESEYDLMLISDTEWLELNQRKITLAPEESGEIILLSNHPEDAYFWKYPFNIVIKSGDLEYTYEMFLSLKDKPLTEKAYNYFYHRPCQLASVILIGGIVVIFLLAVFVRKAKGKLRKNSFIRFELLLVAILIIFAAVIYSYKGAPVLNEPIDYSNASNTHFIWIQDHSYEIDIESFVSDPDSEDKLTFSLLDEDEKHVKLMVADSYIVLTPEEDWYGTEEILIIATDDKGASASSPEITIEVTKREQYTLWSAYLKLCWYVNWVLLLIVFIFLSVFVHKRMRGKTFFFKRS